MAYAMIPRRAQLMRHALVLQRLSVAPARLATHSHRHRGDDAFFYASASGRQVLDLVRGLLWLRASHSTVNAPSACRTTLDPAVARTLERFVGGSLGRR